MSKQSTHNPDFFEDAVNVYGDHERFDDERTADLISEFNDCVPGREHVYYCDGGTLRCQYCGRPFEP